MEVWILVIALIRPNLLADDAVFLAPMEIRGTEASCKAAGQKLMADMKINPQVVRVGCVRKS